MGFTGSRGAQEQDIRLGAVHIFLVARFARTYTLVVVVDGDRKRTLGAVLADHPRIEEFEDFTRLWERKTRGRALRFGIFGNDFVAQVDTLVANVNAGSPNELADLLLALSAERALEGLSSVGQSTHVCLLKNFTQIGSFTEI